MKMKRISAALLAVCLSLAPAVSGASAAGTSALETVRALGILREDSQGDLAGNVTRAEFAAMLVNASSFRDTVEDGGSAAFRDMKGGHWAGSYVKLAVEQGWMSGYTDGTFRPDRTVTLEEGCAALLRLLGYGPGSFAGSFPTAQLSKARSIGLLDGLSASRGEALTREDCVTLFYDLMAAETSGGQVYGTTLGYAVSNGEIDYAALVSANTKGPYVVQAGGSLTLPFDASAAAVYRNGAPSSAAAAQQYDVYYYNEDMRTVWIYDDKATGTLTGVSPSTASPTSATVAGIVYPIESSQAAYKLSSQGQFRAGSLVTLLLGKDGGVVDAISALDREAVYYGVVVSTKKGASSPSTSASSAASAQSETVVACTDGSRRTFYHSGSASVGQLVAVTSTESGTKVSSMPSKSLSGTVSASGTRFAGYDFADGVEILDTDSAGGYARIYPSRLAGTTLEREDVRCYTLDASGKIDRLILREATGDTWSYIYVTSAEKSSSEGSTSSRYEYLEDGQSRILSASAVYPAEKGGAILVKEADGSVKSIRQLRSVRLDRLGDLTASNGSQSYRLAEDVQVLLSDASRGVYAASLSQIDASSYVLTGWYDDLGCSAGGLIRVLVAVPK